MSEKRFDVFQTPNDPDILCEIRTASGDPVCSFYRASISGVADVFTEDRARRVLVALESGS